MLWEVVRCNIGGVTTKEDSEDISCRKFHFFSTVNDVSGFG